MSVTHLAMSAAARYGLEFSRPHLLGYLWLVLAIWAASALAARRANTLRLMLALACRTAVFALLILALAGLSRKREVERPPAVFAAVDVSDSMGEEGRAWAIGQARETLNGLGSGTAKGVILFARGSEINGTPGRDVSADRFRYAIPTDATDISSAIRAASLALPASGARRLLIFSDGNENSGDARAAAALVAGEKIRIDCFAPPARAAAPPRLAKLDLPEEVNVSEKFVVRVLAENRGRETTQASLALHDGETLVKEWTVAVKPGTNAFELPYSIAAPGTHTISASLASQASGEASRDAASVAAPVLVVERPRVLCVSGTSAGKNFFAEALAAKDIDVTTGGAEILPDSMGELNAYDCVVLSNLPRAALSRKQMEMLASYVRDHGGGLIMLGGAGSFGQGGYRGTPVEELLPVRMEEGVPSEREKKVRLCIIMLIDRSGSMKEGFGWEGKMLAARRAAEELVKQLQPNDMVGIITFDVNHHVLVPLGPVEGNREAIIDRIRSIYAGGGTIIAGALAEALREMQMAQGRAKHVILLTDGKTSDMIGQGVVAYRRLIAALAQNGVTVSTIGIGSDADSEFLKSVAMGTGGDYYYVKDATTLPLIVLHDTRRVLEKKGFVEDIVFVPRIGEKSEMLKGISQEQIPRLLGYSIAVAKPRAEVALYTNERTTRDPILASWRVGLGKAVAFTSDAEARWSKEMVGWSMYAKFWTQILRWTMRERPSDYYLVRARRSGGRDYLELAAFSPVSDEASFRVVLGDSPGAKKRTVSLHQVAPDMYAGEVRNLPPSLNAVTVEKREKGRVTTRKEVAIIRRLASAGQSTEKATVGNNEALLEAIAGATGGALNPPREELVVAPEKARASESVTAWLLPFIFLLLLADIALRKFA